MYDLYSVFGGKTTYAIYAQYCFDLVCVSGLDKQKLERAEKAHQHLPMIGCKWVFAKLPEKVDLHGSELYRGLGFGTLPLYRPDLYQPLEIAYPQMIEHGRGLTDLQKYNKTNLVQQVLNKHLATDAFLPLKANAVDMTVLINKKEGGKVIVIVDFRPWAE